MSMTEFQNASWILAKTLSLGYFVAFLSLSTQVLGILGRQGILSIDHFLNILDGEMRAERFYHIPSVFWFASSDVALKTVCFVGMMASSLAFLGFSQSYMFLICFICYLSFVSCGQIFLSYQWDSLLLEFGFLGLFFAPLQWEWTPLMAHTLHPLIYVLTLVLLFKLMFLSGLSKITLKDTSWRDLTALRFHYWTQPLPTPLAFLAEKLPLTIQRFCCLLMFFIELVVPFFIFIPGPLQLTAVIFLATLQILILLTGNFGFFNLLTLGLILGVLSDASWGFKINWVDARILTTSVAASVFVLLLPPTFFWIFKTFFEKSKRLDFMLPWMRFLYPFKLNNPYGLFAIMTRQRPEIILEGSNDGETWQEYEFSYKPGNLKRMLPIVAPHQPRLDWQMWFASLESFNENLWLQNLVTRIFQNSPDVLLLFAKDPFQGQAPKALRFVLYQYRFTSLPELYKEGRWWHREIVGPYSPIFERSEFMDGESSP